MRFENQAELGSGIYTLADLANILGFKYYKVRRLLDEYWNKRLVNNFSEKYSWDIGKSKAVSFHTLIEFYIFYQFRGVGVPIQAILKAHKELSKSFGTPFPFANSNILNRLNYSGKQIVFEITNEDIIDLDSSKQLNMKFIRDFMYKLDFDRNNLAERLYPMGKKNSVVVDPKHQFGQPTIKGTNLFPKTIFNLYQKREPKTFIASSYNISLKQVNDAIEYCKNFTA